MCMARVNIYLPDELAERARDAELNVSHIARDALQAELSAQAADRWLSEVRSLRRPTIDHALVQRALDETRAETGDEWPDHPANPDGR